MRASDFEEIASNYPMPGGLEYVAAAYERLGALFDSETDPDNETLYAYYEAAYGEEFWAYEEIKNKL